MLDSIYHMTLRLLKKRYNFVIMYATLLWTTKRFPKIDKPLVVLQILLHDVISLPDATSYDKCI